MTVYRRARLFISVLQLGLLGTVCGVLMLASQSATATLSFDVASVKPTPGDSPFVDKIPRRSGSRVFMHNAELASMVAWAYSIHNPDYELAGGKWDKFLQNTFDVDAIAPPTSTEADVRLMFRDLLETRFHLQMHQQGRQLQCYDLLLVPGGTGLAVSKPGSKLTLGYGGSSTWVAIGNESNQLIGHGASMDALAVLLTKQMGAPVRDRTGLTGVFDYTIPFTSDLEESTVPLLTTAIRSLGLTLRKERATFKIFVVDRVDAPKDGQIESPQIVQ